MANLAEVANFDDGIYQIETTDPVQGGADGIANKQAKALANRTKYLKQQVDSINEDFAPKANPTFTGAVTLPSNDVSENGNTAATTKFVGDKIDSARPFESNAANIKQDGAANAGALATVARADHVHPTDSTRAPINSPSFTGAPTAPTPTVAGGIATKSYVDNAVSAKASLNSPAFTGAPTAPTPTTGGGIATKDYVDGKIPNVGGISTNATNIANLANRFNSSNIKECMTALINSDGSIAMNGGISSCTRNSKGYYTITFPAHSLPVFSVSIYDTGGGNSIAPDVTSYSSSSAQIKIQDGNGSVTDRAFFFSVNAYKNV